MLKFLKNITALQLAHGVIGIFLIVAVLNKFLANDIPILAKSETGWECPVCQDYFYSFGLASSNPRVGVKEFDVILPAFVPFSPYEIDLNDKLLPPGSGRHLFGTDHLGRDVLAGLIRGTAIAAQVSLMAVAIALVLGMIIGLLAGYKIEVNKINLLQYLWILLCFTLFFFYAGYEIILEEGSVILPLLILVVGGIIFLLIGRQKLLWINKKYTFPISGICNKMIEVRESIPSIFLLLASIAIFRKASIWNVIIIIGLVMWSNMARYIRAEVMKVQSQNYIIAARMTGISQFRLLWKHILPNVVDPILATLAFTMASVILIEASLSFLGIGIPIDEPTWGAVLTRARIEMKWWLALMPGICIFAVVTSFHIIADNAKRIIDPRLQD